MDYVLFGLSLFGFIIVVISVCSMLGKRHLLKTGNRNSGTICQIKERHTYSRSLRKRTTYYPYVEFHTGSDFITAKYSVSCNSFDKNFRPICKYKVSDKVNIVYNPKNPKKFVIDAPQMVYFNEMVAFTVGIAIIISPIVINFMESFS